MIKIGIDKESVEFIVRNLNIIVKWLSEAIGFYFKPNLFFKKLIELSDLDVFKRLLFYFIFFEALIICFAVTIKENLEFNLTYVLGSTVFDIVLAIPILIILFLTYKITKVTYPLKTATVFLFCTKMLIGCFPTIFSVIFIEYEVYLFAILRAAFIAGIIIFIYLGGSIIFAKNLKQAILIFSISVSLFIFGAFSQGLLIDVTQISDASLARFNPLNDPISDEFLKHISKYESIKDFEYGKPWRKIRKYLETADKYDFIKYDNIREDSRKEYNQFYIEISETIRELNEADLRFDTNKEIFNLLILFLEETKKLQKEYSELYLYLPTSIDFYKKMNSVGDQLIITQDAHIEFLSIAASYNSLITKLQNWWIIF